VAAAKRQIIGLGGGGFLMEPENPLLDQYLLDQCRTEKPKACFVGTAGGDSAIQIAKFRRAYKRLGAEVSHLSLFKPPEGSLEKFVLEKDLIYVGGGNTRNLMVLWREWGLDRILRKAWEQGIVLAGVSAGSLCWFEEGITDSITGSLTPIKCLGFLKGSNNPHYDGETERRPAYHRLLQAKQIGPGLAADDGVALHFVGDQLEAIVSSRPHARAYRVGLKEGEAFEEGITPRYLGRVRKPD
jgi:dipeptidase E